MVFYCKMFYNLYCIKPLPNVLQQTLIFAPWHPWESPPVPLVWATEKQAGVIGELFVSPKMVFNDRWSFTLVIDAFDLGLFPVCVCVR